jgi:hypothetical protein
MRRLQRRKFGAIALLIRLVTDDANVNIIMFAYSIWYEPCKQMMSAKVRRAKLIGASVFAPLYTLFTLNSPYSSVQ